MVNPRTENRPPCIRRSHQCHLWFYPAEGQKEHGEDKQRLKDTYSTFQIWSGFMHRIRKRVIYKIQRCSRHHGDRQHPILYSSLQIHDRKHISAKTACPYKEARSQYSMQLRSIYLGRIFVVEACKTHVRAVTCCKHSFMRQESKRVCIDKSAYFIYIISVAYQFFRSMDINPIIACVFQRSTCNTHMYLCCTGFTKHPDDLQ